MNPFQYIAASTPADAVSLIGPNGRYLAGGIDLLGEMKDYIVSPSLLVALRFNAGGDKQYWTDLYVQCRKAVLSGIGSGSKGATSE